jgi:hypothetical protein
MLRKQSSPVIRDTGDLPSIPVDIAKDYPSLNNWWDDSVSVIDRLRTVAVTKQGLLDTLEVTGDVVGTEDEQEIDNKVVGGGSF